MEKDILIGIITGIISGLISGYIITIYFNSKNIKDEFEREKNNYLSFCCNLEILSENYLWSLRKKESEINKNMKLILLKYHLMYKPKNSYFIPKYISGEENSQLFEDYKTYIQNFENKINSNHKLEDIEGLYQKILECKFVKIASSTEYKK